MKLKIPVVLIKRLEKEPKFKDDEEILESLGECYHEYSDENETTEVISERLNEEVIKTLQGYLDKYIASKGKGGKFLKGQINNWFKIKDNPTGVLVKTLRNLEGAFQAYMKMASKHMLFQRKENNLYPYLVTSIKFHDAERSYDMYVPAYIEVALTYIELGEIQKSTLTYHTEKLTGGVTVKDLLDRDEYSIGNKQLMKQYEEELKVFNEYKPQVGEQFLGTGMASELEGGYGRRETALESEGVKHKLVIDTDTEKEDISSHQTVEYLEGNPEDNRCAVPYHLYIKMFDLTAHVHLSVHVNDLQPYVYDPSLIDKLILPKGNKELIHILVEGTTDIMEDIIKGKTGGIIVMATGAPGTGKTLTAEVYSEVVKRPLYVVQSSQLGIDVNELEENLKKVLERADRWKAILLIDEVDVYVHERGNNLTQNAVVGVFLRVLEYYRGILFMTSNREVIIDDAIISRATAHIRYDKPTKENLIKIWHILSDQFEAKIPDAVIKSAVKMFPNISGRDVKNLVKLSKLLATRQKKKIDIDLIEYISHFQTLSSNDSGKK